MSGANMLILPVALAGRPVTPAASGPAESAHPGADAGTFQHALSQQTQISGDIPSNPAGMPKVVVANGASAMPSASVIEQLRLILGQMQGEPQNRPVFSTVDGKNTEAAGKPLPTLDELKKQLEQDGVTADQIAQLMSQMIAGQVPPPVTGMTGVIPSTLQEQVQKPSSDGQTSKIAGADGQVSTISAADGQASTIPAAANAIATSAQVLASDPLGLSAVTPMAADPTTSAPVPAQPAALNSPEQGQISAALIQAGEGIQVGRGPAKQSAQALPVTGAAPGLAAGAPMLPGMLQGLMAGDQARTDGKTDIKTDFAAVLAKTEVDAASSPAVAKELLPDMKIPVELSAAPQQPVVGQAQAKDLPLVDKPVGHPGWAREMGDQVVWLAGKGVQAADLQLNPPHLGPLSVRINIDQDQASLHFVTHNAVVREALEAAVPKLREMMGEQNLSLLDVNVSQQSFSGQRDHSAAQFASDQRSQSGQPGAQFNGGGSDLSPLLQPEAEPALRSLNSGLLSLYA